MMRERRIRTLCSLAGALALAALAAVAACRAAPPLHGTSVGDPLPAAPLRAAGADGRSYDLASEKGHLVLLYFGYTHCPDICPATLADWARARRALGPKAEAVRFIFVSVDPERDTPAIALAYARQFDSTFVGIAPTAVELEAVKKAWGIAAFKEPTGTEGGYGVAHPAQAFLLDREGRVTLMYPPGTKAEDLASDIRRVL
jgi:protein SCO1/2